MLAKVRSVALYGLEAHLVTVEADIANGMPCFEIVGLPEAAVKESRERVKAALKNAGFIFPAKRIIINLAPADLKKSGTGFDLPIAVALLLATDQLPVSAIGENDFFFGELSLDGSVAAINGVLPMVGGICAALGEDVNDLRFFLPETNSGEAAFFGRGFVQGVSSLRFLGELLFGTAEFSPTRMDDNALSFDERDFSSFIDMSAIKGQTMIKRGLEIAAAGGHNALMIGVPGSGKTLLARSFPSILPPLSREESLDVTSLYSLAGELGGRDLVKERPFRSPHHTSSAISLTGGGAYPKPGEISLATHGVLFLDEIVEFPKNVLEVLRQPLEDKVIHIARASGTCSFPADFQLIAACNPCPCGYFGDPEKDCRCTDQQINRYFNKLSGPLLDRIDLHMNVSRVTYGELHDSSAEHKEESSAAIRRRVIAAREIQRKRYEGLPIMANAGLDRRYLDRFCVLDDETSSVLEKAFRRLKLSARGHDRILKVARTIADLASEEHIKKEHILEAIRFRSLDRK